MEDLLALVVVLVVIGSVYAIGSIVYRSHKKAKKLEAERKSAAEKYWEDYRQKPRNPSPADYAQAISQGSKPKSKPAMKKINNTKSYANIPMTSTTSTAGTLDIGDVITGALVLNELFGNKSESSSPKVESSSWGLGDSDSRKSISDSMDSSWGSSDSSSSDSGPSSDW